MSRGVRAGDVCDTGSTDEQACKAASVTSDVEFLNRETVDGDDEPRSAVRTVA
jgi:hypothetical protein